MRFVFSSFRPSHSPSPIFQPSQSTVASNTPSLHPIVWSSQSLAHGASLHPSTPSSLSQISPLYPSFLSCTSSSSPPSTFWSCLNWKQQDQAIIGEAVGDESGNYVALTVDGMNLVIGAPGANHNDDRQRYVKVYHREGNELSWKQLGPDINGEADGELLGIFGYLCRWRDSSQ